jgi:hypothetical protein
MVRQVRPYERGDGDSNRSDQAEGDNQPRGRIGGETEANDGGKQRCRQEESADVKPAKNASRVDVRRV